MAAAAIVCNSCLGRNWPGGSSIRCACKRHSDSLSENALWVWSSCGTCKPLQRRVPKRLVPGILRCLQFFRPNAIEMNPFCATTVHCAVSVGLRLAPGQYRTPLCHTLCVHSVSVQHLLPLTMRTIRASGPTRFGHQNINRFLRESGGPSPEPSASACRETANQPGQ